MNKVVQVTVGTVAVDYAIDRKITPMNIVANIAASVVADQAQKIAKMNDTVSDLASNAAAAYFINQIMGNKSMTMARLAAYTVISSDLVGKQIARVNTKVMKKIEPVPAVLRLFAVIRPLASTLNGDPLETLYFARMSDESTWTTFDGKNKLMLICADVLNPTARSAAGSSIGTRKGWLGNKLVLASMAVASGGVTRRETLVDVKAAINPP